MSYRREVTIAFSVLRSAGGAGIASTLRSRATARIAPPLYAKQPISGNETGLTCRSCRSPGLGPWMSRSLVRNLLA